MINVEAEHVRLWVNEHERPDGTKWASYSISTSSKDQEGGYINKPLEVRFRNDAKLPEGYSLKNGELVTIRGSLSNRAFKYKGEDRVEHLLWAHEIDIEGRLPEPTGEKADSFEQLSEDIPF